VSPIHTNGDGENGGKISVRGIRPSVAKKAGAEQRLGEITIFNDFFGF